jgi:hypothetical protein
MNQSFSIGRYAEVRASRGACPNGENVACVRMSGQGKTSRHEWLRRCHAPHSKIGPAHWLTRRRNGIRHRMARSLAVLRISRGSSLRFWLCAGLAFASASCFSKYGRESRISGYRSPSYDYQQQPRTAGGDAIGADRKPAADKLAEGPTQESLAPGWSLRRKSGLSFDPNKRVGGNIDTTDETQKAEPDSPP